MLKELVVFCAVLAIASAAQSLGKPDPKPEKFKNVKGCYLQQLDEVIPYGKSRDSAQPCIRYSCGENWVTHSTCGAVLNPTNPGQLDKPYPACCPH